VARMVLSVGMVAAGCVVEGGMKGCLFGTGLVFLRGVKRTAKGWIRGLDGEGYGVDGCLPEGRHGRAFRFASAHRPRSCGPAGAAAPDWMGLLLMAVVMVEGDEEGMLQSAAV
jgi:hypothetical protein